MVTPLVLPIEPRYGLDSRNSALVLFVCIIGYTNPKREQMKMKSTFRREFFVLLLAMSLQCLLPSEMASAQSTTGSVYGTVTDSTGAIVPGIVITITNVETGKAQTALANDSGEYLFPTMEPGNYAVSASQPGFKSVTQKGIALSANQNIHANFVLEIGSTSDTVTVSADTTLVDTRGSQLAETIEKERIQDLPLNGRNAYDLATIVPGVSTYNQDSAIGSRTGANFSINGLPTRDVSYYLDGAYDTGIFQNGGNILPNPDALREFRLLTSNFDAEFGRSPGGVLNIITNSGTKAFHGKVYEYLRNDAFNGNNYFSTGSDAVTPLKQNQFGANVGGPLLSRGRAFFFLSYEGLRIHTPVQVNSTAIVTATALERMGDFSQTKAANGTIIPALKGVACNGGNALVICPASLDPVALALLKFVPVYDSTTKSTIQQRASGNSTSNQGLARIDYQPTAKHQVELLFFNTRGTNVQPNAGGNQIFGYSGMQNYENVVNAVVADTWTISAHVLNTFRGFYTQNRYIIDNLYAGHNLSDFGSQIPIGAPVAAPLRAAITGYFIMGTNQAGPNDQSQLTFGIVDTMNLSLGRHDMKLGGAVIRNKYSATASQFAGGNATFTGSTTGNALADFLEGKANTFVQSDNLQPRYHQMNPSLFIQDDWKASKRLTLNLGVRWEAFPPFSGTKTSGTFVAGRQSKVFPSAPVGLLYEGDDNVPAGVYHTSYTKFGPRVGFAYDVFGDGKTSLRGGFGVFYEQQIVGVVNNLTQQPFGLSVTVNKTPNLVNPYAPGKTPFPTAFDPANPKFTSGATITGIPADGGSLPYVEQYNLTMEQQLSPQWALRVAYVGNAGRKFFIIHDSNAPVYAPGAATTTVGINARRPYQPTPATFTYGAINLYDPANNSGYNGLQTSIRGRIGRNLNLLTSYVWSKTLNYDVPFVDFSDIRKNRGLANEDIRNRYVLSLIYKVPDTRFGGEIGKLALSGWQVNGVTILSSGTPFTVTSGVDTNLDGTANDRPNLTGNPYLSESRGRDEKIARYFNTTAFSTPVGAPYGTARRNSVIGPKNVNTNLSAFKTFPLYRESSLQFRAEVFNAFGNVNLNNPNALLTSPQFGQITGAGPARIGQFALKLLF